MYLNSNHPHPMSDQISASTPRIDPYQYLHITLNPDGTITRDPSRYPNTSPTPDSIQHPSNSNSASKDIPINQSDNTWARIFLPRKTPDSSSTGYKLPLIVYYHGGGFINGRASSTVYHDFCSNIAAQVPAVVLSVDYRLAPEHRLPAAYDDAVDALHWIQTSNEVWLTEHADYSNCFIMGTSAGANIAYHAGLRISQRDEMIHHERVIKIKGLVLHHPYFSGTKRTESELRMVSDPYLPQCVSDLMWNLSLPISTTGAVDLDHEFCNPTVAGGSRVLLENLKLQGWRVLVTGCDGDPLMDRQIDFVEMMEQSGVTVVGDFREGGYHIVEIKDPSKALLLYQVLKDFISSC